MWPELICITVILSLVRTEITNTCSNSNCRWTLAREAADSSKVTVEDNSVHSIIWKWDIRGGYWKVTYSYKYPSEWYSGKAEFIKSSATSSGQNAFVSWGSSVPWVSNAVPIYGATPWNLTYNGDLIGFVPTANGRYYLRIYSRNKRHNPFGSEPIVQSCSFTSQDPSGAIKWWQDQKTSNACPNPTIEWNWQGKNGLWTVQYTYKSSSKTTICDVYYMGNGLPKMRLIKWELDEMKQSVSYATNPVRIYEDAWQVNLGPSETWGFTPTGNGLWIFQHFSRNLVFQPFQNLRGSFVYSNPNLSGQNSPTYYTVGPGQNTQFYTVGPSPIYSAETPFYQIGTQPQTPIFTYQAGQPYPGTQIYTIGTPSPPKYTTGTVVETMP